MLPSSKETRSAATRRVECVAQTWLWRRGCRVIAREVGFGPRWGGRGWEPTYDYGHPIQQPMPGALSNAWGLKFRADLVGVSDKEIVVIEVKGTKADAAREVYSTGKWCYGAGAALHCLFTVPEALSCIVDIPWHWHVVVVDGHDIVRGTHPRTLKSSPKPPQDEITQAHLACARALTAASFKGVHMARPDAARKLAAKQAL